ncbi:MAG: adenosylcobinamide amidohydrolase [Syntrophobacteraceae bacterium]
MLLGMFYDGLEIHRKEKIVYGKFLVPHRVISTCGAAGGIRDDLAFIYNHQSCEPAGHNRLNPHLIVRRPELYREMVACRHGLPHDRCATLGTAANMRYAAIRHASFRDLEVVAVCTGGVEANAGRAGDPASVYEEDGIFQRISVHEPVEHGTINTLLFINRELTPGAMVRAVMTATEAKTAALQELAVNSRYSDGLATGTGTDQIGVASRLDSGHPLTGAGKHSVLGELIGKTVHDSISETLGLQNGLTPEKQRSSVIHLQRFGATQETLLQSVRAQLDVEEGELLARNFQGVERDPLVVAAVAALVHLRDKVAWGILPASCVPEIWAAYGAQVAVAVSGDVPHFSSYRETLEREGYAFSNRDILRLVAHAMALGFKDKWPELDMEARREE